VGRTSVLDHGAHDDGAGGLGEQAQLFEVLVDLGALRTMVAESYENGPFETVHAKILVSGRGIVNRETRSGRSN
jgi:hypothetical protein